MSKIRCADLNDLKDITEIYNEAIVNTVATFDTNKKSLAEQEVWFKAHGAKHPIFVAEQDEKVVAWSSLSSWSDRCAYSDTAEISTYVHPDFRGKGIGTRLKAAVIEEAKKIGIHSILSRVAGNNDASIVLNKKLGFELVGTMKEVGMKFGKLHDVHLYQLMLVNKLS